MNSRVPSGPLAEKWTHCVAGLRLLAPARRSRYRVVIVGAGLAGCSLAAALGELGYSVVVLTMLDSPRRSHSAAAQGGINACKNYANDGDNVWRMFADTLRGGDFRAREASVYRLAELSTKVIDHCTALGVPFAREYGGGLRNRSFGGVQVSRTFYARGETGHQLLVGAHAALSRQIASGRVQVLTRTEMVDLCLEEGRVQGILARNLVSGELQALPAHAVVMATGGYSSVYYLSTNAVHSNASAIWRCHRRGAWMANPSLVQFHPTCLPEQGENQCKLTLMSEALRNDGRCWVPKQPGESRRPDQIPESERDYFLERMYPQYGNLVPRDIAARASLEMVRQNLGVGATQGAVYLDFAGRPREVLRDRYSNLFQMYREITGADPYSQPMEIAPAAHFSMGGLWVDYHLRTNLPGLFCVGESNCADHGANRLGANSLLQTLVDGWFIAPLTVADELAGLETRLASPDGPAFEALKQQFRARVGAWLDRDGSLTPMEVHRQLGQILRREVGLSRNSAGLRQAAQDIDELSQTFRDGVKIGQASESLHLGLEQALRVQDFLELGQLMVADAQHRQESCGSHFREDFSEGRDDDKLCHVSAWEWGNSEPHREPLEFTELPLSKRSYQ
jgi:succinate dehydrogenase / fumarate reductase flavoprotein subunit